METDNSTWPAAEQRAGAARHPTVSAVGPDALPRVYVTDVVQGLLLAGDRESAAGQAYNITNDQPLTQDEFLRAIAHKCKPCRGCRRRSVRPDERKR